MNKYNLLKNYFTKLNQKNNKKNRKHNTDKEENITCGYDNRNKILIIFY